MGQSVVLFILFVTFFYTISDNFPKWFRKQERKEESLPLSLLSYLLLSLRRRIWGEGSEGQFRPTKDLKTKYLTPTFSLRGWGRSRKFSEGIVTTSIVTWLLKEVVIFYNLVFLLHECRICIESLLFNNVLEHVSFMFNLESDTTLV